MDVTVIRRRVSRMVHRPWIVEFALVFPLYWGYEILRSHAPHRVTLAFWNARAVEAFESAHGLAIELSVNRFVFDSTWLSAVASVWYQLTHEIVTLGVLLWLWFRHRAAYRPLRTALVIATLAGLVIYWVVPLAPPRFSLPGAVDTMLARPVLFAGWHSVTHLENLYAAMPSLHVAWATWCALAIVVASRNPRRQLAWAYPAITTFVVLGTANHYLLDTVAGATDVGAAWLIARGVRRARSARSLLLVRDQETVTGSA